MTEKSSLTPAVRRRCARFAASGDQRDLAPPEDRDAASGRSDAVPAADCRRYRLHLHHDTAATVRDLVARLAPPWCDATVRRHVRGDCGHEHDVPPIALTRGPGGAKNACAPPTGARR